MNLFNKTPKKAHELNLAKTAEDYIELKAAHETLKAQKESVELNLQNDKRKQEMVIEEERHNHKLEIKDKDAAAERLKKHAEEDKKRFEEKLQHQFDIKEKEAISLAKLDGEQQVAKLKLEHAQELHDLKVKHAQEVAASSTQSAKEFYEQMKVELSKMNTEGNVNTKLFHEMTLKLIDKAPSIHEQRQLTGTVTPLKTEDTIVSEAKRV